MECKCIEVSPEDLMRIGKNEVIKANKGYIQNIEVLLKAIKKLDPKDRLDYASAVRVLIIALGGSVAGWRKWCNIENMSLLKLEEFEEIFPEMRKITLEWLEIDKKITEQKTEDFIKELEKLKEKPKTKNTRKFGPI